MTRTLFSLPLPEPGLQVVVVTVPDDDRGALLCIGRFETPIGPVIAIGGEGTLWALGMIGEMSEDEVRADLRARWPRARYVEAPEALQAAITALISGGGEIRVRLVGTEFQMKVWRALLDIHFGELASYGDIADMIGQPGAVRAVGTAVGQNPVSWAVPCHRVTLRGGKIGNYHWGESIKRILLAREGAVLAPLAITGR
ncbi:methylated-DNA--[protein]-cysteine S-methyltransferase [Paracoccus aminophilus]|uniref:methylated-DNA--[protein]-cysteine S-methyltransferase n=1 Tax=Paracoccus aminophilus JCM 7686 TaxID=1367847 RepID=S5XRL1_PARAH|nr:methylated-DNA--[protein]-cysteine S-methyltransferase [Paracoccus aminophilus]AGT07732.1 ADA regulatory protein [Paracoccus aminophilus JCM 7686]